MRNKHNQNNNNTKGENKIGTEYAIYKYRSWYKLTQFVGSETCNFQLFV